MLHYLLDEEEFLSPYGIRALSKVHTLTPSHPQLHTLTLSYAHDTLHVSTITSYTLTLSHPHTLTGAREEALHDGGGRGDALRELRAGGEQHVRVWRQQQLEGTDMDVR